MAYDFRASQIRTNKIIASGSTGTSASILLYGHENDGVPPLVGNFANTFNTGSIGADTFLYVSGSENKRSVFGGGLTLSGTVVALQGLPLGQDLPDVTYQEGLFETWTANTTIGYAVKEINNLLKALAPARPPFLSSLSSNNTGNTGRLMVDVTHPYNEHFPVPSKSVDDLYGPATNVLGMFQSGSSLSGKLADNVSVGPGSPFAAYSTGSLNKGDTGTLKLYINDVVVKTVNLAAEGAVNDIVTGFVLSPTQSVLFPTTGIPFEGFKYRTGLWKIGSDHQNRGYNKMKVVHEFNGSIYTTNELEWFIDGEGENIVYDNEQTSDLSLIGTKHLSGVKYYTGGSFKYLVTGSNVYDGSVYSHNLVQYTTNYGLQSVSSEYLPAANGDNTKLFEVNKNVLFQTSGIRLIDGSVSIRTTIPTVFGPSIQSTGVSVNHVLLDNVNATSTATNETFTSETYRLPSNVNFNDLSLTTGLWDSSISLVSTSTVGYNDGLQVGEGKLRRGSVNWSSIANGPAGNVDYSTGMGTDDRTFYRMFIGESGAANFVLRLNGSGAVIVNVVDIFSAANQMKVEFKAPTQTGWLCAYDDFIGGQYDDGDGGRAASFGAGRALNADWGLTIGVKNIVNSNHRVYLKITVPHNFSGYLSSVLFTFL
jgi:hypothetical protein